MHVFLKKIKCKKWGPVVLALQMTLQNPKIKGDIVMYIFAVLRLYLFIVLHVLYYRFTFEINFF